MDQKFIANIIHLLSDPEINPTEYKFQSGTIEPIINSQGQTIGNTAVFVIKYYNTEFQIGIRQLEIQEEKLVFMLVQVQRTYFSILFNLGELLFDPHIMQLFINEWNSSLIRTGFETNLVEVFDRI